MTTTEVKKVGMVKEKTKIRQLLIRPNLGLFSFKEIITKNNFQFLLN